MSREERKKFFQSVSPDGSQLTYNQSKLFFWDSATSGAGLQENDTICTINIPLLVALFTSSFTHSFSLPLAGCSGPGGRVC